MIMELITKARFWNCVPCEVTGINERFTHEEWIEHMRAAHPAIQSCKGCEELLTKFEYAQGKGNCRYLLQNSQTQAFSITTTTYNHYMLEKEKVIQIYVV